MEKKRRFTSEALQFAYDRYVGHDKEKAEAFEEALLLEGLESGEPIEGTPEYWERKKRRLAERTGRGDEE